MILNADARRWYLELRPGATQSNLVQIFPGSITGSLPVATFSTYNVVWKFRDCPAMVIGPWYMRTAAATDLTIIEQLYQG